ncbi:hypothetical protein B0H17DRAFT_1134258 [Mycena rosella]|uniref:Uncharacterized protein n=1 Tax=Mycena rosella TaxID=1033263 RepID=A0AAD7DG28_MYCRO|nr:hypothetical protein B0H17DRAFT_1134258 [Mycena rosella]
MFVSFKFPPRRHDKRDFFAYRDAGDAVGGKRRSNAIYPFKEIKMPEPGGPAELVPALVFLAVTNAKTLSIDDTNLLSISPSKNKKHPRRESALAVPQTRNGKAETPWVIDDEDEEEAAQAAIAQSLQDLAPFGNSSAPNIENSAHCTSRTPSRDRCRRRTSRRINWIADSESLSAQATHVAPVPATSRVWTCLCLESIKFLAAAARGLQLQDVEEAVRDGVLELSIEGDERPFTAASSMNGFGVRRRPKQASPLSPPVSTDAAWAILELLCLGEPVEDIHRSFRDSLFAVGHGPTVDLLFQTLATKALFSSFLTTLLPLSARLTPYSGESGKFCPWQRHDNDMKATAHNSLPTRFGNFASINTEHIEWSIYHLVDLDMPLSPGIRTDVVASDAEAVLIRVHRDHNLNSAVGGFIRRFIPDDSVSRFARTLLPPLDNVYGAYELPHLSALIAAFLQDERRYIDHHHPGQSISEEAYCSALRNLSGVLRGLAPEASLYRLVQHLLNDNIPLLGDLTAAQIARWLGISLDFWRFILQHIWFWIHCAWFSRLLMTIKPVVVGVWSNHVFHNGHGRTGICVGEGSRHREVAFLAGTTSDSFNTFLPQTPSPDWYPLTRDGNYLEAVGTLLIIQTGFDTTKLCLAIPNLDCGLVKYDPSDSCLVEYILYVVSIMEQVAVRMVESMRAAGTVPNYEDADAAWLYFETLRSRVETELVKSGLRDTLNSLKASLSPCSLNATHTTTTSPDDVAPPYSVPGFTEAEPLGPARLANTIASSPLVASLRVDRDVQSRRGLAGTATLHANKAAWEELTTKLCALIVSLQDPFRLRPKQKKTGNISTIDEPWTGQCTRCGLDVVGKDQNCLHVCVSGPSLTLSEENFLSIQLTIYTQDIFCSLLLSPFAGSEAELGFVRISAQSVINRPGNREIIQTILPGINLDHVIGDIFVPKKYSRTERDPHGLQLTLAVDCGLDSASLCPFTEDTTFQCGEAWGCRGSPLDWLDGDLSIMKCAHGTLKIMQTRDFEGFYEHACERS